MIILIGVGHVFAIRDRVKEAIRNSRPSVVCLELDALRLRALLEERQRQQMGLGRPTPIEWRGVGRGALIYGFIAKTQARLAKSYGSAVGDEMLAAAEAAREAGVPYELIDMDSRSFFANWMRRMSRRERAKLFLSVLGGLFTSRRRVEKELQEYYNNEEAFVDELARHFPATKTALIDERNAHMARGIVQAKRAGPVVVAVIGEGHVAGIRNELIRAGERPQDIQVVSLQDLQGPPQPPHPAPEGSNVEYSFSIKPPQPPGGP